MAIKRFITDIFDWIRPAKQTKQAIAGLIQDIFEKKVEELRVKGERGPIAHIRYLAIKEFYGDKAAMRRFLFSNGFYIVRRKDVENLKKIKDKEKEKIVWRKMDTWGESLTEAMNAFFNLIEEKVLDLKRRGSIDADEPWGLRFLAAEEFIEKMNALRKI